MDTTKQLYTNASIVIGGAVCAVMMANHFINQMSYYGQPSVVPGFRIMSYLCYPLLYYWAGMLLRAWKKDPEWWIQVIVAGVSLYCLYRYRHFAENWHYNSYLFFTMAGIGYLVPPGVYLGSSHNRGWISLLMAAMTAFCYTALATVKERLLWGPIIPGHPDMELMMETLLVNAEPLMVFIMTYFVMQFSFSRIAQKMGSLSWFRGIVAVPCVYMFFATLFRMITYRMVIMIDHVCFITLEWFIVQPMTVYLVVFLSRLFRERRKGKEERRSWKELAKI
jgi:hypothetical protein